MTQKAKNLWDQLEREQLLDLKKNLDKAHSLGLGDGVTCHVRILNRGEQLFFCMAGRACMAQISTTHGLLYRSSLKVWDDGSPIFEVEKTVICQAIVASCRRHYQLDLNLAG